MNLMMPTLPLASPEFVLLIMGCLILLVDVFVAARFRVLTYFLVQATVALAFILTIFQYQQYFGPLTGFRGHYLLDQLAILLKLFIYPLSFLSFAYARTYLEERKIASSEYYILGLFCVMGMSVMASAYSLLTIYLGLELLSLPLYALVASYKDSEAATEAAMKY
ncbi:MAG TPA: proton-conducting transporter membrane subunit, partial [Gammaproteobacteria bacterium]|nr:proton-conducting transporter membrane subunit [Gammaproteobacteria bacterium]